MTDLSDAEIDAICAGLVQNAAKVRHLQRLGLTVRQKPNGRPLVNRAHYDAVMCPAQAKTQEIVVPQEFIKPLRYGLNEGLRAYQRKISESTKAAIESHNEYLKSPEYSALQEENRRLAIERRAALIRHHSALRRSLKLRQSPPWADHEAIKKIYQKAQAMTQSTGIQHHVDHIVPLQGKNVSGLHVAENLQILTFTENIKKSNKFEVAA